MRSASNGEQNKLSSILEVGASRDVGLVRSENQDNICALLVPNTPQGITGIFAVADGMGGGKAGDRASQIAINGVVLLMGRAGNPKTYAEDEPEAIAEMLRDSISQINSQVYSAGNSSESMSGMGTTLTIAVLTGSTLVIGHVGDSRAYLLGSEGIRQLTTDHTFVSEEVARGVLTEDEARVHPRRNLLTRAVGPKADVQAEVLISKVMPGETVLLCSDGLHGLVEDRQIAGILESNSPKDATIKLVDMANEQGGTDNVTALVALIKSTDSLPASAWTTGETATIFSSVDRQRTRPNLVSAIVFPFAVLGRFVKSILVLRS